MVSVADFFAKLGLVVDGKSFAKADAALGGLKHQLLGLAGAALAGFGLKELIDGTSQLAASVDDASHSIGIDTDALQELSYAAKLSGTDTEGLKQGITILSRTMYDASQGGKETAKSFADVGVAITDANGNLRPAEDVMGDLADHFASLPDAATKTALSMKFFGRSGATLIPLMNEGSKGMADMRQEARDLGYVLDKDTIAAGARLDDNFDRLKMAMVGVRNTIGGPLLESINGIVSAMVQWIRVNRAMIGLRAGQVFTILGKAFKVIWTVVKPLIGLMGALMNNHHLLVAAGIALGVVLALLAAHYIAVSVAAVASAIASAAAWFLAAAPIALLLAMLAIIVLVFQDVWVAMHGGKSLLKDLWDAWKVFLDKWMQNTDGDPWWLILIKNFLFTITHLGEVWDFVVDAFKNAWKAIAAWWDEHVTKPITAIINWAVDKINWIGSKLKSMLPKSVQDGLGLNNPNTNKIIGDHRTLTKAEVMAANLAIQGGNTTAPVGGGGGLLGAFQPANFQAGITINAAPGQSAEEIANVTVQKMDGWWASQLRKATTGGTEQ